MKIIHTFFQLFFISAGLLLSLHSHANEVYYHELTTPRGEQQPIWLIENNNAVASLIMFAGGHGKLKLSEDGVGKLKKNFLVRTRNDFADKGFNVVLIDKPKDRKKLFDFRTTQDHADDVSSVIEYLRKKYKKPVWLIGTSRGTLSAANAAARLDGAKGPDGIVLTATVMVTGRRESVEDVELENIKVPSLFTHNRDDGCHVCPYDEVEDTMSRLKQVKDKQLISYQGGRSEVSNPCKALTPHGFLGLEDKVIADISDWIKSRLNR